MSPWASCRGAWPSADPRSVKPARPSRPALRALGFALLDSIALSPLCADGQIVQSLPAVEVIGTTLLPGSGVAPDKLPANVQVFSGKEVGRQFSGSLTDFLATNATGITLNAAQGNSYQPDVNVRGFAASPLLGTPQGISVFFDGLRMNELFGDTVNWDLIPPSAIGSIQLIPGSDPAFGMNTLGGAIAIYSKSGATEYREHPGGSLTVSGGAFGRRTLGFETGGQKDGLDWFVTGNDSSEHGWAEHNPSRVRQLFAKVGLRGEAGDLGLSLRLADNRLEGAQTLPASVADVRQSYTWPDINANRLAMVALSASRALSDAWLVSANAYGRQFRNRNFSSNANDAFAAGDAAQAVNDSAVVDQRSWGASVQLSYAGMAAGLRHRFSAGLALDDGLAHFTRSEQPATFTPDRGTAALADFALQTDSDSRTRYSGVFLSDAIDVTDRWTLTLAGRFNRAGVSIADRTGLAPQLDGSHRFQRFNPAVGLNYNPRPKWTAYASYSEGMRAPTAIELTCADPAAPCKLPNNFVSDPPLKQVVSRTVEVGVRGTTPGGATWSAALFRTELRDDLQFVASNGLAVNAGYFQNVGTTRRQGLELGAAARSGPVGVNLHYSFLDATYRHGFVEHSPFNSTADANGAIVVQPGNRIPGLPRQVVKARFDMDAAPGWNVAANVLAAGRIFARGDENNRDVRGAIGGYAVVNLDTRYAIDAHLNLFARIDNLLDRRHSNFGVLAENAFVGPGGSFDGANARTEQFRGYGAPRGAWAGLQYVFP
jgi:iron complex outermembrane recepter protein